MCINAARIRQAEQIELLSCQSIVRSLSVPIKLYLCWEGAVQASLV